MTDRRRPDQKIATRKPVGLRLWNRVYGYAREPEASDVLWTVVAAIPAAIISSCVAHEGAEPSNSPGPVVERTADANKSSLGIIGYAGELTLSALNDARVTEAEHGKGNQ